MGSNYVLASLGVISCAEGTEWGLTVLMTMVSTSMRKQAMMTLVMTIANLKLVTYLGGTPSWATA